MSIGVPRSMVEFTLNALKGWPAPHAVDFVAKIDPSVEDVLYSGTVVSLNSSGFFIPGVGSDRVMPMFLFSNSDDPDVVNNGGDPATKKGVFRGMVPRGDALALVAVGGYELVSTQYDTADAVALNTPNQHLTSPKSTAAVGKLKSTTYGSATVCGVVSRGIVNNGYGHDGVAFWPVYLPIHP